MGRRRRPHLILAHGKPVEGWTIFNLAQICRVIQGLAKLLSGSLRDSAKNARA